MLAQRATGTTLRALVIGSVAVLGSCGDPLPALSTATPGEPVPLAQVTPVAAAIGLGATPLAIDENGIPGLLRGTLTMPRMPAADATTSARPGPAR